jgi:DNA-binding transcriptional LysR family regulator
VLVGPQLFLREIVLPWWAKHSAQFPQLQLEVQVSPLGRISLETIEAGADAGILEHKEELADYVCRPIYTERWGIVRHPGVKKEHLKDYIWGTNSPRSNIVDTWLVQRQKLPPPRYRFYWQDLTAVAIWVAETPGAASVLPWHTVVWLVKRNRLVFEPLPDATTRLYLAYPRNNPHKRLLKALSLISEATPDHD